MDILRFDYETRLVGPDEAARLAGEGDAEHSDDDCCLDLLEPLKVILDPKGRVLSGTDLLRHIAAVGRPMECVIYRPVADPEPLPKKPAKPKAKPAEKETGKSKSAASDFDSTDYSFAELVAVVTAHVGTKGRQNDVSGVARNVARGLAYGPEVMFDQKRAVTIRQVLDVVDGVGLDGLRKGIRTARRLRRSDATLPIAPSAAAIVLMGRMKASDPGKSGVELVKRLTRKS